MNLDSVSNRESKILNFCRFTGITQREKDLPPIDLAKEVPHGTKIPMILKGSYYSHGPSTLEGFILEDIYSWEGEIVLHRGSRITGVHESIGELKKESKIIWDLFSGPKRDFNKISGAYSIVKNREKPDYPEKPDHDRDWLEPKPVIEHGSRVSMILESESWLESIL